MNIVYEKLKFTNDIFYLFKIFIRKEGFILIRIVLIIIILIIFSIISLPLYLMEYFIGKKNPKLQVQIAQKIVVTIFKIILVIAGGRVTCTGLENVPTDRAVLYVGNHRDYFDILTGYTTVPTLTSFVSKKELQRIPCINHWMSFLKCLFLDRENPKEGLKTILQGINQIKEGFSVFIMPEGTRNCSDQLLPFHEGSFKLATKTGCPIIPVAMKNTDKILSNHLAWIRPTQVKIAYGKPIYLDELSPENKKFIGAYSQKIVQEMLENL